MDNALTELRQDSVRYWRRLPEIPTGTGELHGELGVSYFLGRQPQAIALDEDLAAYSDTLSHCVMLYEEAHVYVGNEHHHDKKFRKEILRAVTAGGCRGPVGFLWYGLDFVVRSAPDLTDHCGQ